MIYVHASKKMKIEATEKLQEEQEAESSKPMEDEWGVPIYESDASSPQNLPQSLKSENSGDEVSPF
jgi:hypothetical protein